MPELPLPCGREKLPISALVGLLFKAFPIYIEYVIGELCVYAVPCCGRGGLEAALDGGVGGGLGGRGAVGDVAEGVAEFDGEGPRGEVREFVDHVGFFAHAVLFLVIVGEFGDKVGYIGAEVPFYFGVGGAAVFHGVV